MTGEREEKGMKFTTRNSEYEMVEKAPGERYECCHEPVKGYPFCPEHGGDPEPTTAAEKPRLMAPWNNVVAPPSTESHPDVPGLLLHYYRNRMGLLVPLWPKVGPIPLDPEERRPRPPQP